MLTLDGSHGEGGGQVLRTALALAVALGRAVRLTAIRARRRKPGLRPQHLAVVRALAALSDAEVHGDVLNAGELTFVPHALRGDRYRFDIAAVTGSAGSVALLFQAVLLPLVRARTPSEIVLLGGTHVPWSPPVHYLTQIFLPALHVTGLRASVRLERWGWYPAGGGEVVAAIEPLAQQRGLVAVDAPVARITGLSAVSRLPRAIAERQRQRVEERLGAAGHPVTLDVVEDHAARGPGTFVFLALRGRAGFSALGRRGVPAEQIADAAVEALLAFLRSRAAVDERLADQLLPFLALAGEPSELVCPTITPHLATVAWVVEQFLPGRVQLDAGPPARVRAGPPAAAAHDRRVRR